jgi:hexosaminidase
MEGEAARFFVCHSCLMSASSADSGLFLSRDQQTLAFEDSLPSTTVLLHSAVDRLKGRLLKNSFVPRKFHPRKSKFEPNPDDGQQFINHISIVERSNIKLDDKCHAKSAEAYTISISANGNVEIEITSSHGGLRALETLVQLFYSHSSYHTALYTPYAPLTILDCPAFEHRGLNLDISRNWIAPADVLRTIDAMALNKFNRLRLHATDSQSWPLEIPALPLLALEGAYDPDQIWTVEDLRNVQRHGHFHGIEVYLEIDIPGHTTAVAYSYPNLTTAVIEPDWSYYALEPPSGQLRLNSTEVYTFLTTVLNDLLPRTSPYTSFYHIGGDELNLNSYLLDPTVKSSDPKVLRPLIQFMIDHVISLTHSHSLTPIVCEEMLLYWNLTFPQNTIIEAWRTTASLAAVLARGHKAIFGANTHWYLNCGIGTFLDPNITNPHSPIKDPYTDYCDPYKSWRQVYSHNPLAEIPRHQLELVVGGEVHLWGELNDGISLDGMLWPRAAAAAEVLWSGVGKELGVGTTRRLAEMRERLVGMGIRAGVVQMEWCLRNEGWCTL